MPRFRVIGMDARGHGDSSKPEEPAAYAWAHFAADYLAVAERLAAECGGGRVAVGLGHSFGGTSVLGAAAQRPELFGRLVLVDPVIPPPPEMLAAYDADPERSARLARLIEGARKRRSIWPSLAAARKHFESRALFADWLPEALDLYLEYGLRQRADGQVELRCPGEVEAAIFSQSGGLDVEDSRTSRDGSRHRVVGAARRLPAPRSTSASSPRWRTRASSTSTRGHLVPMEHPELVVAAVLDGEE